MTSQLHPYVVHFPVALLLASVLLFFVGFGAGAMSVSSSSSSEPRQSTT